MEKFLKRLLSFAIALFMVLGMVPASAFDVFAAESTEADLVISTVEELQAFAAAVNGGDTFEGKTVVLANDIEMKDSEGIIADMTPIGSTKENSFKGTFDGQNNTISDLYITYYDGDDFAGTCVGLFGVINTPAVVKNVTVHNPYMIGQSYVGAIVGMAYTGTIENCHVTGEIDIEGNYMVGGITGHGYARIADCSVIGAEGWDYNTIAGVYYAGNLEGDNVGGIVGHNAENNSVSGCTVENVNITGTRKIGGIVGITAQSTDISDCSVKNVTVGTTATADYAADNAKTMSMGGIVGQYMADANGVGGSVTNCSVSGLTFTNENAVTVNAGALTGGVRGTTETTAPAESNVAASGNTVATVENATVTYLEPAAPAPSGSINGGLVNVQDPNRTFLTIESYITYANESIVVKVFDANDTLLATSSLVDNDRVILGKENWGGLSTFVGINCTDSWWNTSWEEGKLSAAFVPAKATLYIDGVEMNTGVVQMRAAGSELPVNWAEVPGVAPVAVAVAQTMDAEGNVVATYTDFEEALAAACADESVVRLEIVADYETDTVAFTEDYYNVSKALTIGVPEGETHTVTISPVGDSIAVCVNNGGSLTIEEGLTINHLDVTANGYATTGENTTIDGTLYAVSLKQWASNGTVTVSETGKVILGNGDGQLDLAYGNGTVTVNGNGDKTTDQFKAGYSGTRGNGNTLNLNNTSFEAGAWFNINGSNGTINVDNSVLKVSGGDSAGTMTIASSGNAINLTNGSLLKVDTLTLGAGNTLALDATSSVEVNKLTGAGALVIDATGLKAGDTYSAISGDLSGFTGTIEVTGASLEAEIVDGKIVLKEEEPAYAIEVTYADGTVAYFNDILEAVPFKTNYDKVEGATIKLLGDYTGSGIRFCENDMVLDLNSFTYTINEGTGSNTTRTSAFQVRPEVTTKTTVKNGTIKIAPAAEMHEAYGSIAYMFNNYAPELVLENVVMDMENMTWSYGTSVYAIVSRAEDGVKLTGTTTVENFNAEIGGEAIYNGGAMEITATGDFGAIALTDASATVTGAETLNVVSGVEGYVVSYSNGVHSLIVVPALPTATVTEIEKEDLTFALNFKADEATQPQLDYYGTWMADYVLTINKTVTFNGNGGADGYLAGQYDAYSENWVYVPFEDVTLEANTPLRIMEYALSLMPNVEPGSYLTYNDVYGFVKEFNCGIFFEEEFLAANPDLEVTLELRMYNPENQDENYTIGETYEFVAPAPELPTATVTEIEKEDLTFALNFKADEATQTQVDFYGDWYADYVLTVNKDVTFNANGAADGYLAGQYDEYSENWVYVPFEDVSLKAGESIKIMEYAANALNKPDLKLTYNDVYSFVKDFDCGVFFDEEFLAVNPDLEVRLELRMYNPADETESYTIGETYVFVLPRPELPTATATEIENDELTFAMNFKADEATPAQLYHYGSWYADYVLTVNKDVSFNADGGADGYLSGQYDKWSENWVDVPYGKGNVTLKAGEGLQIMKFAAELMGKTGLRYTYKEIYEVVKDFDCGVFFTPEFLAANPDLEVRLELRMYNPADETENYLIGETYVFTLNPIVAENVQSGVQYSTVADALLEAAEHETVRLLTNVTGEKAEDLLLILNYVTLDLNGYTLEANSVMTSSTGGQIIDNSNGDGLLKVAKDELTLVRNERLPIWSKDDEGYRFVKLEMDIWEDKKSAESLTLWYWFTGALDGNMKHHLANVEENDLKIGLLVNYKNSEGRDTILNIVVPNEKVIEYAGIDFEPYFTTTIRGLNARGDATITTYVASGDVEILSVSYDYKAITE